MIRFLRVYSRSHCVILRSFRTMYINIEKKKEFEREAMSDTEQQQQSIDTLLPAATVCVYSTDGDTLTSTTSLADDWRFARVDASAVNGGVSEAIAAYKEVSSPDLLIIQTDEVNDAFTGALGELSAHCDEGTAAIIIGPENDVYLYRKLIEMGISDYLVRPIKPEMMADVISKALVERLGVSDSKLIAFIGAKGGVGTSSLTQLAALITSHKLRQQTLLMDGAGGWSPFSVGIGFDPAGTLHEIVRSVEGKNVDALKRMFYEESDKLTILASGADAMLDPSVTGTQFETLLDALMVKSPLVFVDASCSNSAVQKAVVSRASQIVIVSEPTVTSLRFCRGLIKEISDIRGGETDSVSLIVNKQGLSKTHEVPTKDMAEALDFKPDVVLPYLPEIFLKNESDLQAIIKDASAEVFLTGLLKVLQKSITLKPSDLPSEKDKKQGIIGGLLSKLGA